MKTLNSTDIGNKNDTATKVPPRDGSTNYSGAGGIPDVRHDLHKILRRGKDNFIGCSVPIQGS